MYLPALDERSAHAQLQELHPALFLDKEADALGRVFYTVRYAEGSALPELILDWREPDGRPRPLSSALAHEVRKMMHEGPVSIKELARRNHERRHSRDEEFLEAYEDIARDHERHRRIGSWAVVPRSQRLRQTRDKMRAKGIKT